MRGDCVYYAGTNRFLLKSYLGNINLLRYTLGICKYQLRKRSKYIEIYLLPFSVRFFHRRDVNYNLRINSDFAKPNLRFAFHGSESISHVGAKICDIVPLELKELTSIVAFKKGTKDWKPKICPCPANICWSSRRLEDVLNTSSA